ncbi:MAG: hypothetical protein V4669_03200 [Pseudomonadota bacterium]
MNTETADNMTSTMNGSSTAAAESKVHRVAQKAHETVDRLERTLDTGSEKVIDWHSEYSEAARAQVRSNPLAVVAGAFALGYLLAKVTR